MDDARKELTGKEVFVLVMELSKYEVRYIADRKTEIEVKEKYVY